jgi:hypothetical protein
VAREARREGGERGSEGETEIQRDRERQTDRQTETERSMREARVGRNNIIGLSALKIIMKKYSKNSAGLQRTCNLHREDRASFRGSQQLRTRVCSQGRSTNFAELKRNN